MSEIQSGTIIVANPQLGFDPVFGKSVILVCDHVNKDGIGTLAFNIAGRHFKDGVYQGGPMPGFAIALHKLDESIADSKPIGETGFGILPLKKEDDLKPGPADVLAREKSMAIVGYAGWGEGQLTEEMAQGAWKTTTVDLDTLMALPAEERWEAAVKGTDFAID